MHAFPFKESHVNIYNVYILTPIINFFFYSFCDNNNYFSFSEIKIKKNETKSHEWRTYHGEVVGRKLLWMEPLTHEKRLRRNSQTLPKPKAP